MLPPLNAVPAAARGLGFLGLLPFAGAVIGGLLPGAPLPGLALTALLAYGASILSFLGGVRWGLAIAAPDPRGLFAPLLVSVLPSLAGWLALLLPPPAGLLLLAAAFVALLVADLRLAGAPPWYAALRLPLTAGAVSALLLGLLL